MKKLTLILTLLILVFALLGCQAKISSASQTDDTTGSLSSAADLLVGTLKLEGSDQAVSADQAKTLLMLWQMLKSLSSSSTVAEEEIQAVVTQITSAMTAEQLDAIAAMQLTRQDMFSQMGGGRGGMVGTPDPTRMQLFAEGEGMPFEGEMPPMGELPSGGNRTGNPPLGEFRGGGQGAPAGGFVTGGQGVTGDMGSMSATLQAGRTNSLTNQLPVPLLDQLIQLLQQRAGS
jgi:hypothetical protein